jgi:hypothetical protein
MADERSGCFLFLDEVDKEFPFPASWVLRSPNIRFYESLQANVEDIKRSLEYIE